MSLKQIRVEDRGAGRNPLSNLLENTDGVLRPPVSVLLGAGASCLVVLLTCALLMTSSHSEGPAGQSCNTVQPNDQRTRRAALQLLCNPHPHPRAHAPRILCSHPLPRDIASVLTFSFSCSPFLRIFFSFLLVFLLPRHFPRFLPSLFFPFPGKGGSNRMLFVDAGREHQRRTDARLFKHVDRDVRRACRVRHCRHARRTNRR